MERWVKIKDKWVRIVFTPEKTFVDGVECEASKDPIDTCEPIDSADWWKNEN
jgi:hypothetical protein